MITLHNNYQDFDRRIIMNEWKEATEFFKNFTKEDLKRIFGKNRNCHKVIRTVLNHCRRYGFIKYQKNTSVIKALAYSCNVTDDNIRYDYDISTYAVENLEHPNASTAIKHLCEHGIIKLVQPYDRDEFGRLDEENIKAAARRAKNKKSNEYVRPNRFYANRFIMYILDSLLLDHELSCKNNFRKIDLSNVSLYGIDFTFKSINSLYHLISLYLFSIRIIILDSTNYYNNYTNQIIRSRGYNIERYLKDTLNSDEDKILYRNLIEKELRHYRLEQSILHQVDKFNILSNNQWIEPMLHEIGSCINSLNDLLPELDFRFKVSKGHRNWCGDYYSTRVVCNVTTSRDSLNNPNLCDLPCFQYNDGSSFFKRPRTTERANRYDVLEDLGLDSTSDELYDIKSCLPNLIICYQNKGKWHESDRHSEVCSKFNLRNRNVAKIGAFRGIFNWWKSDKQFLRGIEQNLSKSSSIDYNNDNVVNEIEWLKNNGYYKNNTIQRTIKDADIPKGFIFSQYCADTFNSAIACRDMYKNDMYPSDLFIIESLVEVKTMLYFAKKGHVIGNAYDHLYTDGKIPSDEFHLVYGKFAEEVTKEYIELRNK